MKSVAIAAVLAFVAASSALAQTTPQSSAPARTRGFLTAETTPDAYATIPPAPKEGEPRNDADWAVFRQTRVLEGTDRWKLAQSDNALRPADLLKAFSCAMDADLTPENAPTVAMILGRTTVDAGSAANRAKEIYKRTRPFQHNPGNICIDRDGGIANSYDYPSGHSSLGWAAGLVLSELAPDRTTQLMTRARAYGDSRTVCGVHNWSAVEAGRTNAAGVYAALHGSREFLDAMAKARGEVDAARKTKKPDAAACAREAELTKPLVVK